MKQEVVPTSPQSPHRKEHDSVEPTAKRTRTIFIVLVVSILVGAISGMLGFVIAANVPSDWPVVGKLNVTELFARERQNTLLDVRGTERSLIDQSPNVISEIASVYSQAPTISAPSTFLGNAVVASSDGWLVIATSLLPNATDENSDSLVVVLADGAIAKIDKRADDVLTGTSFIHVDAKNLDVANFSSNTTASVGQVVSVVEKQLGSYVVYERKVAGEAVRSNTMRATTRMDQQILVDPSDIAARVSSPVFSNNGDLLGLVVREGVMVPAAVVYGALQSVIAGGVVERSTADMDYINTARLTDDQKTVEDVPEQGITVLAIREKEAAGAAKEVTELRGLMVDDTITSINGISVTEFTDWSTIIHSKPKGTTWRLQVLREGKQVSVDWVS